MVETTNLYILIFPERRAIKIGKANDIHNRTQALKRWWGEADYEASYYLSAPARLIFELEKCLHFLLSQYAVLYEEGDGRTEIFSIDALDVALKQIDLYSSSNPNIEGLKKGVPRPILATTPPQLRSKHTETIRKSKAMVEGVTRTAAQFDRINRLIIILLRRQSRIPYQYDVIDDCVYFRFRLSKKAAARLNPDNLIHYFRFNIEDLNGRSAINCCSVTEVEDVMQFRVHLLSENKDGPKDELFAYFATQSKFLLKKLPQCSLAATSPIPMLDGSQVLKDLLQNQENGMF
ncbi:GIY-YIG nuclease family protein [Aquisalimonas asiatica]|uniref:T5orf172 domain-containing protein n=1 Tax=Aquisalimonas asiatica TaxID=406100 RepID=A0A1H8S437_9GAMM|nr:GIY-YIG nuclease family protein [Aquisalimonas asiatica]SEO73317.1 T5orf172 domain-containing protein [Aquisalimonas asiatica]